MIAENLPVNTRAPPPKIRDNQICLGWDLIILPGNLVNEVNIYETMSMYSDPKEEVKMRLFYPPRPNEAAS
jgi:hypothetical protein